MKVIAKLNYLRIAPRKLRLVADSIRGKSIKQAQSLLEFSPKKSAPLVKKVLDQAIANAKNNLELDEDSLSIVSIKVDEGPKLKRWRARARGRAMEIQKKTSHITLVLEGKKKKKVVKKEPVVKKEEKKKVTKPKTPRIERKKLRPEKTRGLKRVFKRKAF